MKRYRLDVTVEPLEDGRYLALVPALAGCMAEGDTIAEAIENVEDAARMVLKYRVKQGWPLPDELSDATLTSVVEARVVVSLGN